MAALVLPFPAGKREKPKAEVATNSTPLPAAPAPVHGVRPTGVTPVTRDWLRAAVIGSLALHATVFLAFQMKFADDLERAAGAAVAMSSDGTLVVPIEIVIEAPLPSAPAPTNATQADAKTPVPTPPQAESEPEKEKPLVVEVDHPMPRPPVPAPVVLPAAQEAARTAVPVEESAPAREVETAKLPEAPPITALVQVSPRDEITHEPEQTTQATKQREERKTTRASPSVAASPNRAASSSSSGRAGAGGVSDNVGRAAVSSYQALVLAHLSRHRVYPPEARQSGITGVARVRFALASDGRVLSASLTGGSGAAVLDAAAVAMVHRAAPFPPFPAGIGRARIDFAAPIRFDLR